MSATGPRAARPLQRVRKRQAETTTRVTGYFNPNSWPLVIEIPELNLRCELRPGQFICDRGSNHINDPIFEDYVHPKGLGRAVGEQSVPIRYVPRVTRGRPPRASPSLEG